ncbi:MAG: CPBP family intramembrane metalloprotease [Lachnospiraceae bacterium]|nr:CPBP family intramembrane metalloprotease [Lachnospiraceae bacterium]
MSWIFYVFLPMIVYLAVSEGIAVLAGGILDSAACTALSAALTLPVGVWMLRQDEARHRHGQPFHAKVREEKKIQKRILGAFLCIVGGGVLNIFWSGFLNMLRISSFFSNETQEELLASQFTALLIGPCLLVPVTEEIIYRGLTYSRMRTRMDTRLSIFLSALLFALCHGNPIQMIYAFPMAVVLALLYERSGSLVYLILFHMGANLTTVLLVGGLPRALWI